MTSDAADREKRLAEALGGSGPAMHLAAAIAAFVRSELAAHEQAHHGTAAADQPAVEHMPGCASWIETHPPPACDCGASDPKAATITEAEIRAAVAQGERDHATVTAPSGAAPDREAPKPLELPDRITLWARSQLGGYHIDTHGGEWNAQPLVPFEVVQVSALTEAIVALRALVNSLPKCDKCSLPATRAWDRGRERYCDKHRQPGYPPHEGIAPEYPRAEPVRRAQALLARHGVKKTTGT